jgi:hypothetical protein
MAPRKAGTAPRHSEAAPSAVTMRRKQSATDRYSEDVCMRTFIVSSTGGQMGDKKKAEFHAQGRQEGRKDGACTHRSHAPSASVQEGQEGWARASLPKGCPV